MNQLNICIMSSPLVGEEGVFVTKDIMPEEDVFGGSILSTSSDRSQYSVEIMHGKHALLDQAGGW